MIKFYTLFLFLGLALCQVQAQKFYRIKGDYSIKAKSADGKSQLTIGKFYYDKNIKKLTYQNTFPQKETWVSSDTLVYRIVNEKVASKYKSPPIGIFSIFHLVLTNQINNYGLKNSPFTIQKVEKQGDMVITTWLPPKALATLFGKVLISNKNNRLFGMIFIDSKDKILRKQFFDKYQNFRGLEFPMEIVDITYKDDKENYQVTTYKNIVIDDVTEDYLYNFALPKQ
jgi:hypothetical protein